MSRDGSLQVHPGSVIGFKCRLMTRFERDGPEQQGTIGSSLGLELEPGRGIGPIADCDLQRAV